MRLEDIDPIPVPREPITFMARDYLPQACQGELWQALTGALDEQMKLIQLQLDPDQFYENHLNPSAPRFAAAARLDPDDPTYLKASQDLDYLASMSIMRAIWDGSWTVEAKRQLLIHQIDIAEHRYDPGYTLPKVFKWMGLDADVINTSGFMLGDGEATAGMLGANADKTGFDLATYRVEVPGYYIPLYDADTRPIVTAADSKEAALILNLIKLFGLPFTIAIIPRVVRAASG